MRAGLLVAVVAAAVLVPTAVLSPAPATGQAFSVQQVLRVFKTAGVPLSRDTGDYPGGPYETFDALPSEQQNFYLSVSVWQPGFSPPTQGKFVTYNVPPPVFAHRGNVHLSLSGPGPSSRVWRKALKALRMLRYSPADASLPQLPTFVLQPGQQRTLTEQETPNGSEVDCSNGFVGDPVHRDPVLASVAVAPNTRSSAAFSSSTVEGQNGQAKSAQLTWKPEARGSIEFSCSAKAASGISGISPPLPPGSASQTVVSEGSMGTISAIPPPVATGPLPPLKLARPTNTLGNEYADVSTQTRQAMVGTR